MPEPLVATLPTATDVTNRIGFLLRELRLARKLLRVAKAADQQRGIGTRSESMTSAPEVSVAFR